MPQVKMKVRSNEGLVDLSVAHPEVEFAVLGAWPDGAEVRAVLEAETTNAGSILDTLDTLSSIRCHEVLHADGERLVLQLVTAAPVPHGATGHSGAVPQFPLRLADGWIVGEMTVSREQLSDLGSEFDEGEIDYRIVSVRPTREASDLLTERQREVMAYALERGYYDDPRRCPASELAADLGVHRSAVSRLLHRAEGAIIADYFDRSR